MGGVRDREEKKKRNNVFSSGCGGGTRGPAKVDKRNQELECPHCKRIFKQVQRFRDHIAKQHADVSADDASIIVDPRAHHVKQQLFKPQGENVMDVGSKGGPWTKKSPRLLLLEWTQSHKRPKPRYKTLTADNAKFRCKVVLPDEKDNDRDVVVFLDAALATETEDNAQQLGALAALHRVAGDRAMHRILPEQYLLTWEAYGREAERRGQQMAERAAAKERKAERERVHKAAEARRKPAQRKAIEAAIKGMPSSGSTPGIKEGGIIVHAATQQLESLGFLADDIQQAVNALPSDTEFSTSALLDWLCIHLPEQHLPASFTPGYQRCAAAAAQPVSLRTTALGKGSAKQESESAELIGNGYSSNEVASALANCQGNSQAAFIELFSHLSGRDFARPGTCMPSDEWDEEMVALEAIYGSNAVTVDAGRVQIHLDDGRLTLDLWLPPDLIYPAGAPLVGLRDCVEEFAVLALQMSMKTSGEVLAFLQKGETRALREATKALAVLGQDLEGTPMCHDLALAAPEILEKAACNGSQSSSRQAISVAEAQTGQEPESIKSSQLDPGPVPQNLKLVQSMKRPQKLRLAESELADESKRLRSAMDVTGTQKFRVLQEQRRRLPAFQERKQVLQSLHSHDVLVISGSTGCGKSTQVPQFILEEAIQDGRGGACNIICTQPRRISAIGLAQRVSEERGETVGQVIGYSVRLDSRVSKRTRLLFCTTGILLRRMMSDDRLTDISHVIIDEVHERSEDSDLLLLLLKEYLASWGAHKPKIILMSATADADLFSSYFSYPEKGKGLNAATLTIPGFMHPVRDLYLEDALEATGFTIGRNSRYALKGAKKGDEMQLKAIRCEKSEEPTMTLHAGRERISDSKNSCDALVSYSQDTRRSLAIADQAVINYDLLEAVVCAVVDQESGNHLMSVPMGGAARAILIFLPGAPEISQAVRLLQSSQALRRASGDMKLHILPLHGGLSPAQQAKVFEAVGPDVQKIVISTNVAETSVTIDDVVCVLDSGRVKEVRYDASKGLSRLEETWVSAAAAAQRRGRAGRVQPGACIKLYSRAMSTSFQAYQPPEVLRLPLHQLCLTVKAAMPPNTDVIGTLQGLLTPPPRASISAALSHLNCLGALSEDGNLSALGRHLAKMPMDPKLGKALIYGAMLRCLSPVLTIVAAMAYGRQVFLSPYESREEAKAAKLGLVASSSAVRKSDHLALIGAFNTWNEARKTGGRHEAANVSKRLFLSESAMAAILAGRQDYAATLVELGFADKIFLEALGAGDEGTQYDGYSQNARIVKAALCAGFYPSILRVDHAKEVYAKTYAGAMVKEGEPVKLRFYDRVKGRVFMHPSSILFDVGRFESPWLIYTDMVETSKVFCREASMVPIYSVLLFGGELSIDHEASMIRLDGWATFKAPARVAVLVKELRSEISRLLHQKVTDPAFDLSKSKAIDALHQLLATDGF